MLSSLPSLLIIPFIILSGKLTEKVNNIWLLQIGLSIFAVSGVLYLLSTKMWQLIAVSALLGVGSGLIVPLSTGLISRFFVGAYRTMQFGLSSAITNVALVLATTGYDDAQIQKIQSASQQIPVFFTFNMSLGINLLVELAKKAATVLGGQFDIEIVEKHHNQKIDAPSGTAIMIANAINDTLNNEYHYVYDRHARRMKRDSKEIGMHSIRGGTIVGEHDVIFAGQDEVITLSHSAASKTVFAVGAVNAAVYLCGKPAGMYDMKQLVQE